MIIDFSHYKLQEHLCSEQEKEQLAKFFMMVNNSSEPLSLSIDTMSGSKLLNMRLLQLIGDTLYLTDEFESMVVLDLFHVKSIEVL